MGGAAAAAAVAAACQRQQQQQQQKKKARARSCALLRAGRVHVRARVRFFVLATSRVLAGCMCARMRLSE
eukprot:3870733-Prymnesium_polylepis.1